MPDLTKIEYKIEAGDRRRLKLLGRDIAYWEPSAPSPVTHNPPSSFALGVALPPDVVASSSGYNPPAGTAINVGDSWQAAVDANPAGTIFIVQDGTHTGQTVIPKAYNQFWSETGSTIMDGQQTTGYAFIDQAGVNGVELHNFRITGYQWNHSPPLDAHAALYATKVTSAPGWTLEDMEFDENRYAGAYLGGYSIVRNCNFHHNRRAGLKMLGTGYLVEHNQLNYNNYAQQEDPIWDVGGIKCVYGEPGLATIRYNTASNNHGSGIWLDIAQDDVVIEYNTCEDNYVNGIVTEISDNTTIRYNTVRRNGLVFGAIYGFAQGPGIQVQNSSNVTIHDNTVDANYNGIMIIPSDSRGHAYNNVDVLNNTITNTVHWTNGAVEFGSGTGGAIFTSSNLDFQGNTYSGNPAVSWRWSGGSYSFPAWQGLGFDV